jgi:tartrate dehydratase beta subunit/fumarate hydratase class I family protein
MQVTVRERAAVAFPSLGEREVWVVAVGVPDAPATVWVDTRTRAVLRVRYDIAARAMSFTDDRVTPLPAN